MIRLLIGSLCYSIVGCTLSTLGIDYHNWQFYTVVAAMMVNEISEQYFARKRQYEEDKRIFSTIIVEKLND